MKYLLEQDLNLQPPSYLPALVQVNHSALCWWSPYVVSVNNVNLEVAGLNTTFLCSLQTKYLQKSQQLKFRQEYTFQNLTLEWIQQNLNVFSCSQLWGNSSCFR